MPKPTPYLLLLGLAPAIVPAEETALPSLLVESTRLSDVSGEEIKSADLADALSRKLPSASIVRRSGIANDVILRGQKKDNINILMDGAKVYGACPNRMDPPTSHILTNNIQDIDVIKGPYDVENFGTLSGMVKVTSRNPTPGFQGEVNLNAGSWGYRKVGATVSGGSNKIQGLLTLSRETSDQYQDGNGNNFAQQIIAFAPMMLPVQYQDRYADHSAYEKRTLMGKLQITPAENQQLKLSYTANRSDDVLYPSSKMDALYDDSDIYNLAYRIDELGRYAKEITLETYGSKVKHPMSTFYRKSSGLESVNEVISALESSIYGLRLKDRFDLNANTSLTLGLDASRRNWDGSYIGKGSNSGISGRKSIDDVDTNNRALFLEGQYRKARLTLKSGLRYDSTEITPASDAILPDNDYNALGGYLHASYQASGQTRLFGGIGSATRVPDARELYFKNKMGMLVGTPDLAQTRNTELDLGLEKRFQDLTLKGSLFHSWLKDFIHYNAGKTMIGNAFENIDARLYGLELSGNLFFTDDLYLDFGLTAQRGRKNQPLEGQTDRDLAEIPPMKTNVSLSYDYAPRSQARIELVAADRWKAFDGDNGEQAIPGYGVVNLKLEHAVTGNLTLSAGVDNLFDRTYATSNTYQDLILLTAGSDIMLMNEPGRYLYLNLNYRF